jgi:hypothetical protein
MNDRNILLKELDTLPSEYLSEVADFVEHLKQRKLKKIPATMLLSEAALAKDWDTLEEDTAWADL